MYLEWRLRWWSHSLRASKHFAAQNRQEQDKRYKSLWCTLSARKGRILQLTRVGVLSIHKCCFFHKMSRSKILRCCCWVHKSCRQGCSLGFDKLVACYKRCNKTPNDQQEMICKRDREERNRIQTGYCCMILRSMWRQETISKKQWCIKLP